MQGESRREEWRASGNSGGGDHVQTECHTEGFRLIRVATPGITRRGERSTLIDGRDMSKGVASSPQRSSAGRWLAVLSVAAIGAATLTPSSSPPLENDSHVLCIVCGTEGGVDVVLNLALFAPLGLGLGLSGVRWWRAIAGIAVLTLAIEGLQTFVVPGRDASLGDLLMNVTGGALGLAAGRHFTMLAAPPPRSAKRLLGLWAALWLAVQYVSAFAIAPRPPMSTYYGQIAPKLGGMSAFDGDVFVARVDSLRIGDGALSDEQSRFVGSMLRQGAGTVVASAWRGASSGIAPIFRIADDQRRQVLIIAQASDDVIFGVRTGAEALKLRPIRLRIRGVRGDAPARGLDDTIRVRTSYGPGHAVISTAANRHVRELRVALRASQGWRIFSPLRVYVDGARWTAIASATWMLLLALPLGFWGAFAAGSASTSPRARAVIWSAVLLTLVAGLAAIPGAFGLPAAGLSDWLSALGGVLLGCAASFVSARDRLAARFPGLWRARDGA